MVANWGLYVLAALKLLTLDMDPGTSKGSSSTYSLQHCLTPYCKSTAESLEIPQPRLSPDLLGLSEPVLKSQIPVVLRQTPTGSHLPKVGHYPAEHDLGLLRAATASWPFDP